MPIVDKKSSNLGIRIANSKFKCVTSWTINHKQIRHTFQAIYLIV